MDVLCEVLWILLQIVPHGNYIVDAKQHGCYGYDDDNNFCLNFTLPAKLQLNCHILLF